MRETAVMVNPAAGGGRAGRTWERLVAALPELAEIRRVTGSDAASARAALTEVLAEGVRRVLAVGGDGTAHQAVNVLLAEGRGEDVALGLGAGGHRLRPSGLVRRRRHDLRSST